MTNKLTSLPTSCFSKCTADAKNIKALWSDAKKFNQVGRMEEVAKSGPVRGGICSSAVKPLI